MRLPGGRAGWMADWSVRQMVLAAVLLVLFVGVAAVVPVLILPGAEPERQASPTPGDAPGPTVSTPVTASSSSTPRAPEVSPSPQVTRSVDPFRVSPAVKARAAGNPERASYQEFPSVCARVRTTTKAPVAGLAGRGASYDVFGSTAPRLSAPGRIPAAASSCLNPGDRSTYWVPSLEQGGEVIEPESFQVLHKSGVSDYTSVQPAPAGLRILGGGAGAAPSAAGESTVTWACTGYDGHTLPEAGTCRDGDRLIARIAAPGCWDGRHLDSSGHRAHLAWAASGGCPASHPVAVPTLLVRVAYPFDAAGTVSVSGLDDDEYGFGAVTGWEPKTLSRLVRDCVNAGEHCGADGQPD
ncbi:DUF1996 domain-containing protein [Kineosporia succinea]|uniref:DUF1996 domain-containing protein n=1 Tax=Kineosporia succinea TaxID=84632 RepID=A0ABT9PB98_9ACTN|nr:DUF1996 domain-containing protein [Kineosporia succinea]MDP9829973.1 hypothetical protein [Kineosporia succinea]